MLLTTERLVAADPDLCGCDQCRADVAAFALARVRPAYAASATGQIVSRVVGERPDRHAEIVARILEGIAVVEAHPRH